MEPVYLSWSGGKDSSLALHRILQSGKYRVSHLLTTLSEEYDRVSIHGLRRSLLREQARSLGIPLVEVDLPTDCSNETYARIMSETMIEAKGHGVQRVVFGDIFLEDVRRYRVENLAKVGMEGIFPLWGEDSRKLAEEFIALGFKARLASVSPSAGLDASFLGREYDASLLADLPPHVDPCGENGEFHTFTFDGPVFSFPIAHLLGHVEDRGPGAPYLYQEFLHAEA